MSGIIGLTPAGQTLDRYLLEKKPTYTKRVICFISQVTSLTKEVHRSNMSKRYKQTILKMIRNEYSHKHQTEFQDIDAFPFNLMRNYICTLTKVDFVPSTKTQASLRLSVATPSNIVSDTFEDDTISSDTSS